MPTASANWTCVIPRASLSRFISAPFQHGSLALKLSPEALKLSLEAVKLWAGCSGSTAADGVFALFFAATGATAGDRTTRSGTEGAGGWVATHQSLRHT